MIPTCTTWSAFQDLGGPIGQGFYKRYYQYLESQRKPDLTASGDPDTGVTDPRTPQPPKKPQVNLEVLLSMVDPTWKPDMHKGLDYLWTIMNEFERESFLKGITTVSTSTSMSTVVPMPPKSGQPVTRPSPPQPPQPQQAQPSEPSGTDSQPVVGGAIPVSSPQAVARSEAVESQQDIDLESNEAQQGTATVNEESRSSSESLVVSLSHSLSFSLSPCMALPLHVRPLSISLATLGPCFLPASLSLSLSLCRFSSTKASMFSSVFPMLFCIHVLLAARGHRRQVPANAQARSL